MNIILIWFYSNYFSGEWGYAPRFKELERKILSAVPEAVVRGAVGRKGNCLSIIGLTY